MGASKRRDCMRFCLLQLVTIAAIFSQCDARRPLHQIKGSSHSKNNVADLRKKLKALKHLEGDLSMPAPNTDPYVSSPLSMPPYDAIYPDQNGPPYCTTPPSAPQTPSIIPTPIGLGYTPTPPDVPSQGPPSSPSGTVPSPMDSTPDQTVPNPASGEANPSPPGVDQTVPSPGELPGVPTSTAPDPPGQIIPSPTGGELPGPPESILSPPYLEPSPPTTIPSPPTDMPSPIGFAPGPPVFLPPIVYPPPLGPPSATPVGPGSGALWCVAKPSVPDPIIQEAMNYACGSGADCDPIQPSGSCFEPNTLFAHASFAFNSYWQRTKVAGGTCSFGGTAMLVTIDPS